MKKAVGKFHLLKAKNTLGLSVAVLTDAAKGVRNQRPNGQSGGRARSQFNRFMEAA